jgi:hypothetical protein
MRNMRLRQGCYPYALQTIASFLLVSITPLGLPRHAAKLYAAQDKRSTFQQCK